MRSREKDLEIPKREGKREGGFDWEGSGTGREGEEGERETKRREKRRLTSCSDDPPTNDFSG